VTLALLCFFSFLAGFVDSVVGGGGLIQLPALLLLLPKEISAQVATVFGINKMASICGTGMAVVQYARRVKLNWFMLTPSAAAALAFSFLGARTVASIHPEVLKPIVFALLVIVAIYTFFRRDLGARHEPRFVAHHERLFALMVGAVIGFYDGFFGPGTGSFLTFIFIGWFGFDFLNAAASTKVINFSTNLSAVAFFAATGHIAWGYALPMGLCNVAGALAGTRLAILKGNRFVRRLFLVVAFAMIARLGWELFGKR
jgi:uncharacterized membrane protein YfcA